MAPKRKRTPSSSSETEMDPERERASSSGTTTYQIFLSFRGPDTRQGFADVLYHSLIDAGICVFRDNEEIRQGEYIEGEILKAISESRIFGPIFSRGYASSKWCLIELSKMFESMKASPESGKKILPIFYDVGVDDVKLKTELYAEALQKHRENFPEDRVKPWEEALKEVGKIKGWELKDMGHADFAKLFARKVSTKLKAKHKCVTERLVRRDDQVEALMNMLDTEASDVRFVGIRGMGGIGKTTLATIVFNKLCDRYEHCSFLPNVRESSQRHGIENLQKQLSSDLGSASEDVMHVDDRIMELSQKYRQKKVLIVLDDVDHRRQIQNLARDASWFGKGSRIIITTRNKEVLGGRVKPFELMEMNAEEALQLFSKHAFGMDSPPNDYLNLSKEAVESTGGLPLALEVIGSELWGEISHKKWAKTIERLKKIPHKEVREMLMISYESLSHGAQQIFLDIACCFIYQEKSIPMYMWEACDSDAEMGLKELIHKSLVKKSVQIEHQYWYGKRKELLMHDLVRDFGRSIAKPNRIWMREGGLNLLHQVEDRANVEMFRLCDNAYYFRPEDVDKVSWEEFSGLQKLRYFECYGTIFSCNMQGLLPNLRWLYWNCCPVEFTGTGLSLKKLVILNLSWSDIAEDWTGWSKIGEATNLKVLDLTGCDKLRRTPDLSKYSSLERLILKYCTDLVEIDRSIGRLKGLKLLNVNGCRSLKGLPDELYSLGRLEVILGNPDDPILDLYEDLTDPPEFNFTESIGNLTSLLILRLCLFKTTKLPESIVRLSELRQLALTGIVELPQRVGLLEKLEILELRDCPYMEELPDSIGDMKSLVELDLSQSGITELPETIGNLEKLRVIGLSYSGIHKLPNSIGKLKSLEVLCAQSCHSLTHIQSTIKGCTSLRILDLECCTSMKELPDSIGCARWRELDLTSRENIKELPVSECFLRSLCELRLSYSGITKLPDTIGSLKDLSILSLNRTKIRSLPASIGMLKNLEKLDVQFCDLLEEIPSTIEGCTRLRKLDLTGCENIKEIPVSKRFLISCKLCLPNHLYFDSAGVIRSRLEVEDTRI